MVVVGIDEVGRGCWAGPIVAGAVILGAPIAGLRDSKQLSKSRREELADIIQKEAAALGIGWVSPREVDNIGLTAAVGLAMKRALDQINLGYNRIVIDGSFNFLSENPKAQAIIKADDSIPEVSAASIIAKVARDNYMAEISQKYPNYGFEKHVGYGTALHLERLKLHGVSEQHRLTYKPIRNLLQLPA